MKNIFTLICYFFVIVVLIADPAMFIVSMGVSILLLAIAFMAYFLTNDKKQNDNTTNERPHRKML